MQTGNSFMKNVCFAALAALALAAPFTARAQIYRHDSAFDGKGIGKSTSFFGVTLDGSGNVYVADQLNSRISKYDSNGVFLSNIGVSRLNSPQDVALDSSGNVYVADSFNYRVAEFSSSGAFMKSIGGKGDGDGQFGVATSIALDGKGNLFATDQLNNRIEEFDSSGAFVRALGIAGAGFHHSGSGDGQLNTPIGVRVDGEGNVYVADSLNNRTKAPLSATLGLPATDI